MGNRSWAQTIAERAERGETLPRKSIELAEAVLGRKILRGGKHAVRPDAKDRQAGQAADFTSDDSMVIL